MPQATSELPGAQAEVDILQVEINRLKNLAKKDLTQEGRMELQDDLQAKNKALAKAEEAKQAPRLIVEDVTVERLAVMLSHRRETLTSLSSDAGGIVNNLLGRYNKTDRTDEAVYLKAWTGENCRVDRQGREPVWLKKPCLSALWLTQPDKVESLLAAQSLKDGGFIQRILLCHSGCVLKELDEEKATGEAASFPPEIQRAWSGCVRELIEAFRKSEDEPSVVKVSKPAHLLFVRHYNAIVRRWSQGELRDVTSFAVRWTEQAWRIALCLHAGLQGPRAAHIEMEENTARCAIQIADWFEEQQLSILAPSRNDRKRERLNRIRGIIADHGGEVTLRDLSVRHNDAADGGEGRNRGQAHRKSPHPRRAVIPAKRVFHPHPAFKSFKSFKRVGATSENYPRKSNNQVPCPVLQKPCKTFKSPLKPKTTVAPNSPHHAQTYSYLYL